MLELGYVTLEKADSLKKANASRGDVVITHRGTLGQIVYIPQNSKYDRYVISQSQFRVRCNDKMLPEYMVYYTADQVKHKIERQKSKYGWEFMFLGANIDAVETADRIGIDKNRAVSYHSDHVGTQLNYEVISEAVCCMRECAAIPDNWADRIEEDYRKRK